MNNYRPILEALGLRALLATPFLVLAVSFAGKGTLAILTPFCLVAVAVILAPPLARLFAEPASGLFYPAGHFDRPPPVYSIPESKRAKGLYEEAIAGFEKIAEEYPDEVKPYVEMIDIAIVCLKDPGRANAIYQRGMSKLCKDDAKEVLARMYSAIRTRLNARDQATGWQPSKEN